MMTTVHSFKVWDPQRATYAMPPLKATARRIVKCGGFILPGTDQDVTPDHLDQMGLYRPGVSPEGSHQQR